MGIVEVLPLSKGVQVLHGESIGMNQLSKYPHLSRYVSNLRSIPGGTYRWGASPSEKEPGVPITMSPFRMGATPVTWGMWKEYCKAKSVRMPVKPEWGYLDNHPVVNVSWNDIMDPGGFCKWASQTAGIKLTLPTEAQWEYAARGGKDGLEYPWGDDFDKSKLWCAETVGEGVRTAAVDRTNRIYRNGYGLTDMVGNASQWCADYLNYNADYRPAGKDPVNTHKSEYRCVRGGSWGFDYPSDFRCADRSGDKPVFSSGNGGFRLSAGQK